MRSAYLESGTSRTPGSMQKVHPMPSAPASPRFAFRVRCSPVRRPARRSGRYERRGFTVVELLVVVATIAVLLAFSVPAFRRLVADSSRAREMAAARQMVMAWNTYATDSNAWVLPGFKTGLPARLQDGSFISPNSYGGGATIAARYPWRIAPYLGHKFEGMYINEQASELEKLKNGKHEEYLYFASLYPSLGMNSTFVGGDQERYAFLPNAPAPLKNFYVQRLSSIRNPDKLLLFASSRTDATSDNRQVEGYFRIESPRLVTSQWQAAYDPAQPASYGNISARHDGTAVCAFTSGAVDTIQVDALRDMRFWANTANAFDWQLTP